jgi:hypothetical protein
VVLDVGVDGRHAAADQDSGVAVRNTGGSVLSAAPGVYLDAFSGTWLFVRGQLPFYQRLRGEQEQLPTLIAGVQYQVF